MDKNDQTLIIVESPSKARTINRYLGDGYVISSSMGHIIDLPKSRLAVDVEHGFAPEYITIRGKAKILKELKKKASQTGNVLLATDPDREGEAISWHLSNALRPINGNIRRIEFNEITEGAIREAVNHPRDINMDLVNAQQARRILDRIVGYNISPILWRKIKKGLSAGRVQSVALRIICEREEEIEKFIPEEYWNLEAVFEHRGKNFKGSLYSVKGERVTLRNKEAVDRLLEELAGKKFTVQSMQRRERKRNPVPPYTTSTLQQDAATRLGFTSQKTMIIAQQLYEGIDLKGDGPVGLISYMRTDSTRVAEYALGAVRKYIAGHYKESYLPEKPNTYANRKNAQDAHEAVRPTDVLRAPETLKGDLSRDQMRLYTLIWRRFVASQMTPELSEVGTATLTAGDAAFRAVGSRVLFDGFTVVDREGRTKKSDLPDLKEGDEVGVAEYLPAQRFTTPPPRYNDASLVKFLEESGIGRPSTYAPTINTLITRYYVTRSGRQLVPTVLGRLVNGVMVNHFAPLVSINFTADMEEKLDRVEEAHADWVDMLREFYGPFKNTLEEAEHKMEDMKGILDEETDEVCERCGKKMLKKLGRFGFFMACSGFPECRNARPLPLGRCPVEGCDGSVVKRQPKKGRSFYACTNYPACTFMTREVPTEKHCPRCEGLLFSKRVKGRGQTLQCLNEKCGFKMELPDEDGRPAENNQDSDRDTQ